MAYGIDFGTTNSVLARWSDGVASVVDLDNQNTSAEWYGLGLQNTFPSVFGVRGAGVETEALFGWSAKLLAQDSVAAVKRLLSGGEHVTVGGTRYAASTVTALLLKYMREQARGLGEQVEQAVITVPAKATGQARFRTREAARRAGMDVLALINEPTAAAMSYVSRLEEEGRFLVFDWGGGTTDVTLLDYQDGVIQEVASHGIAKLGGHDIDGRLEAMLRSRVPGSSSWDAELQRRFRLGIERLKVTLSSEEEATLILPTGDDYIEVTREEFESTIKDDVQRTLGPIEDVLEHCDPDDIDALLFVGGSSRLPLVRRLVQERLDLEAVHERLCDPITAVAQGAAFAAAVFSGESDHTISVVTANALGTVSTDKKTKQEFFSAVIPQNSPLPIKKTKSFKPNGDLVKGLSLEVWEGIPERPLKASENFKLNTFDLKLPTPLPGPEAKFNLELSYDQFGIVSARVVLHSGVVLHEGPVEVLDADENFDDVNEAIRRMFREGIEVGDESFSEVSPTAPAVSRAPVFLETASASATMPAASPATVARSQHHAAVAPRARLTPTRTDRQVIVVDGSNLACDSRDVKREKPSFAQLTTAVQDLRQEYRHADIRVVVDANLRHRVQEAERSAVDAALLANEIMMPPAGTIGRGDALVLEVARKYSAVVVSNDSYKEFQADHTWLLDPGRVLGARHVGDGDWVFLARTSVRAAGRTAGAA